LLFALALGACVPGVAGTTSIARGSVRIWTISYRAHDGARRHAYVAVARSYGPQTNPPIPLVISPHGRGIGARRNLALWGSLPAVGNFAVVSPDGEGRVLGNYSWGAAGQVDDLARMPQIVQRALPWLHIDDNNVYAVGGSMGGQEALLLLARHPHLLAGAAAFDAVADFALQYRDFPKLACGRVCTHIWEGPLGVNLQALARREVGGSPSTARHAYEIRSPITYARTIAFSCVPLQLWWSPQDRIVRHQQRQTGRLFATIRRLNPDAPVDGFTGGWRHSAEMRVRLPLALARFGLLPAAYDVVSGIRLAEPPPAAVLRCTP
jgi:pimeloyl-ACP methyl ester carboxylesterase